MPATTSLADILATLTAIAAKPQRRPDEVPKRPQAYFKTAEDGRSYIQKHRARILNQLHLAACEGYHTFTIPQESSDLRWSQAALKGATAELQTLGLTVAKGFSLPRYRPTLKITW